MESAAGAVADSRECTVGGGGHWWQRRGMVGHARMAPQNPTCEVPLWCTDYSDSTGRFVGLDFFVQKLSKIFIFTFFIIEKNCIFATDNILVVSI